MKANRDLNIAVRTALASLNKGIGRPGKALDHLRALVPWAPNRAETYSAMEDLKREGLDPAPGIPEEEPESLCLFVGYPRSGHSLIGALLDAHPEVVLAHELNFLQGLHRGHSAKKLARYLRYNAATFGTLGRAWSGYSYQVPGQWQGKASRLRILGDKHGAAVTRYLNSYPELLERLESEPGWPITFIHVVRNPFDNIATWAQRNGESLEVISDSYLKMAETVAWLKARWPQDRFLEVHLEDFITDPAGELVRLLQGLGVDQVPEDYLTATANVVFGAPNKTRDKMTWPTGLVKKITKGCNSIPFLESYT